MALCMDPEIPDAPAYETPASEAERSRDDSTFPNIVDFLEIHSDGMSSLGLSSPLSDSEESGLYTDENTWEPMFRPIVNSSARIPRSWTTAEDDDAPVEVNFHFTRPFLERQSRHRFRHYEMQVAMLYQRGPFLDYLMDFVKLQCRKPDGYEITDTRYVFFFISGVTNESLRLFLFDSRPQNMTEVLRLYHDHNVANGVRRHLALCASQIAQEVRRTATKRRLGHPILNLDNEYP